MTDTKDQEYRLDLVMRIGDLIHGSRWIAPLAADLSVATGRAISGPQISGWLSGSRRVPDWIESAILRVISERIASILEEGTHLRREALWLQIRLSARLGELLDPAPDPEPDPEPEPDNAPMPGM